MDFNNDRKYLTYMKTVKDNFSKFDQFISKKEVDDVASMLIPTLFIKKFPSVVALR